LEMSPDQMALYRAAAESRAERADREAEIEAEAERSPAG
jgi:hypothetical protein